MEKVYTREEIKQNRIKFVNGLKEPHREKLRGELEDVEENNKRCCLGHGCDIFGITRLVYSRTNSREKVYYGKEQNESVAPKELIDLLGLHNPRGGTNPNKLENDVIDIINGYTSLTVLNDTSTLSIQDIANLIEGWIEGGPETPFKSLTDYEVS